MPGIDHHHVVPAVCIGAVERLVAPTDDGGYLTCQSPDDLISRAHGEKEVQGVS